MRWATFTGPDGAARVGLVEADEILALEPGVALLDLLGDDGERLAAAGDRARSDPADVLPIGEVRLLAPVPRPPSIRDFYAFEQHVRTARGTRGLDVDADWYQLPVFYFSNPAAVTGPNDDIPVPRGTSELDYELEVAAVIGREGSDLSPDSGEAAIAGFCLMNDWSARDVQRREMRLSLGPAKGKDFATTLGPFLVTPDELAPFRRPGGRVYDLEMRAWVNGRQYTRASLADMHWSFGDLVAYASRNTKVVPGDVIGSGTCGTGCVLELSAVHGSEAYPWLRPGDEVVLEVDGLGRLRNRVVPGGGR